MSNLDTAIRAELESLRKVYDSFESCEGCEGDCYCQTCPTMVAALLAVLAVLDLHADPETDLCVRKHVDYTVMEWHDPATDPTLLAIAEKLGVEVA